MLGIKRISWMEITANQRGVLCALLSPICKGFGDRIGDKNISLMLSFFLTLSCLLPVGLLISSPIRLAPTVPITHSALIVYKWDPPHHHNQTTHTRTHTHPHTHTHTHTRLGFVCLLAFQNEWYRKKKEKNTIKKSCVDEKMVSDQGGG